ncbi:MAG: group III truncated hemoglobin [Thermodesulfobacteriota bacterium]
MSDIETREDVELLVDRFYDKMLADSILGFIFTDIAKVDIDKHKPVICDFWETLLFNKAVYKRGPEVMNVHKRLNEKIPLKKGHFKRWLFLFSRTVDELFEGKRASFAKEKADSIAGLMQKRVGVEGSGLQR